MAEASSSSVTSLPLNGRPKVEVDLSQVNELTSMGFSKSNIAKMLGISRKTLYNKTVGQPSVMPKYTAMNQAELDSVILSIKENHPKDGEVMITGHLLSKGIRVPRSRVRASIHRVDPCGVALRKSIAIKRRIYNSHYPNYVWHIDIDGNHKLIKWRFVIHGAIDGYSRVVTFMKCHANNRASTVLSSFQEGVDNYGLPKKIRSDHGGENVDVWRYMMSRHGNDQCVIVGSSTHNERIERLWRDVHRSVLVSFGDIFRVLEEEEKLDSLNEVDIFCLHTIFLPRINASLAQFTASWNNHALSTEHMQTPLQLFYAGLVDQESSSSSNSGDSNGDSDEQSTSTISPHEPVPVPRSSFQPCPVLLQEISTLNPLMQCADQGKAMYIQCTNVTGQHLVGGCQSCICT